MIFAMITGYKKANGENIKTSKIKNSWATLYVILSLLLGSYIYYKDQNIFIKSKFEPIDYKVEHEDFYFECSDCHNLFPPYLLPKESWVKLMEDQHEHYDEDLELEKNLVDSITKYLVDKTKHLVYVCVVLLVINRKHEGINKGRGAGHADPVGRGKRVRQGPAAEIPRTQACIQYRIDHLQDP